MADPANAPEEERIEVDAQNLYREETFTDLRVASIRRLTPVQPDGSPDPARPTRFIAQTHIMTQRGPVPIDCPIEAPDLLQAIAQFPEAVQAAVDQLVQQVEAYQRESASRIVTARDPLLGGGLGGAMPPPPGQGGGDILLH